ncbi:MAG: hypothetical protein KC619_32285 [Myxococcales bacterium]|nr:hypothetical protein [Myxococcales bacterium]
MNTRWMVWALVAAAGCGGGVPEHARPLTRIERDDIALDREAADENAYEAAYWLTAAGEDDSEESGTGD